MYTDTSEKAFGSANKRKPNDEGRGEKKRIQS